MKKALAIILLLLSLTLSACDSTDVPQSTAHGTEPTQITSTEAAVDSETKTTENATEVNDNSSVQTVTQPTEVTISSEESSTRDPEIKSPIAETEPNLTVKEEVTSTTKPAETKPVTPSVPPTDPIPEETQVPTTPSTDTTETPTEASTETMPQIESIDIATIESQAEAYAASLGFVVDNSLGKGNSGYYPPDYRPFSSMQDSINAAVGLVSATKNQLNSRFSDDRCDVLVEGAYGLARVNCQVTYSHTDELGDWYYIYVFYG